jgi:hypothetical protein
MPILGYNYCLQIIERGFAGAVLDLLQDGARTDLFENLSVNSLKGDLSMIPLSNHLFSHWSIPLKGVSLEMF